MKVWVVQDVDWEYQGIVGVFSSEERARQVGHEIRGSLFGSPYVEELTLDEITGEYRK